MGEVFIPLATTLTLRVIGVIKHDYVLKILNGAVRKNVKKCLLHVLRKRKVEIFICESMCCKKEEVARYSLSEFYRIL